MFFFLLPLFRLNRSREGTRDLSVRRSRNVLRRISNFFFNVKYKGGQQLYFCLCLDFGMSLDGNLIWFGNLMI